MKVLIALIACIVAVAYVKAGCIEDLERSPAYNRCLESWANYMLPYILDFEFNRYVTALCSQRSLNGLRCVWDYMEQCPGILDDDMNEENVQFTCMFFG